MSHVAKWQQLCRSRIIVGKELGLKDLKLKILRAYNVQG